MDSLNLTKKIETIISPTAESMGFELVRVLMVGAGSAQPTLQIMAEKPDGTMLLDDCSRLSQAVSAILDVEDILPEAYNLEVSSPGIDRPLTRLKDFDRYKGFDARIELDSPVGNQKKFKGLLKGITGDSINLESETGAAVVLPFASVVKAKLLLTDALIEAAQNAAGKTGDLGDGNMFDASLSEKPEGKTAAGAKKKQPKFNPKNKQHVQQRQRQAEAAAEENHEE